MQAACKPRAELSWVKRSFWAGGRSRCLHTRAKVWEWGLRLDARTPVVSEGEPRSSLGPQQRSYPGRAWPFAQKIKAAGGPPASAKLRGRNNVTPENAANSLRSSSQIKKLWRGPHAPRREADFLGVRVASISKKHAFWKSRPAHTQRVEGQPPFRQNRRPARSDSPWSQAR